MSNLMMWELISGFISSIFVIPAILKTHWSELIRSLVTFLYCLVVGTVIVLLTGFSMGDWVTGILSIFVSAITTYKGLSQYLPITKALDKWGSNQS